MAEIINSEGDRVDDLRDLISIISTYCCKQCNFSSTNAQSARDHVAERHLSLAVNKNRVESESNIGGEQCSIKSTVDVSVTVLVSPAEGDNIIEDVKSNGDKIVKANFMCCLCETGFDFSEIVGHMVEMHGVTIEPFVTSFNEKCNSLAKLPSCVSSPLTVGTVSPLRVTYVSTGTQVELLKKRGRKRKIVVDHIEPDTDTMDHSDSKDSIGTAVKMEVDGITTTLKFEPSESAHTRTRSARTLEVDRLMEVGSYFDLPKRQIRPPKTLVDDYHIVHQRHWKRQPQSLATEQKWVCDKEDCGAMLSSEKGLEFHMMCHVVGDTEFGSRFCCPECSETFPTWIELRAHLLELHDIIVDKFQCDSCDFRAETASLLEEHNLAVHASETNADDDYTPRGSGMKRSRRPRNSLTREEDGSSAEDLECSECNRKFSDQKSLRRHVDIIHNKVKRFMCSVCGHSTAYKAMLQQHMRKHTGEKPYREKSLRLHMESKHPEAADDEEKSSGATKTVRSGKAKGEKGSRGAKAAKLSPTVFACNICRYQTVNKRSYQTHMATHGVTGEAQQLPEVSQSVVESTPAGATVVAQAYSVLSSLADAATNLQVCAVLPTQDEAASTTQAYSVLSA